MKPWKQPTWIMTTQRTGSTLLCYRLNSALGLPKRLDYTSPTPRLDVFGEHFHPDLARGGYRANSNRPYVTKFFPVWLCKLGTKRLPPDMKWIHLTRRNFQAQLRSLTLGQLWGHWEATSPKEVLKFQEFADSVEDTEQFKALLIDNEWELTEQREAAARFVDARPKGTVLHVAYEDLVGEDAIDVMESIFHFMGFEKGEYDLQLEVGVYKTGL